ncbi:hypothetical protein, partial [Bacillus subtilis]|uniref:hypothetical protein n=1 Tax=Bacillus subtilis TaxID=1423 RepID=UPI003EB6BD63
LKKTNHHQKKKSQEHTKQSPYSKPSSQNHKIITLYKTIHTQNPPKIIPQLNHQQPLKIFNPLTKNHLPHIF